MSRLSYFGIVSWVHNFLSLVIEPGDKIIDATCGNGKDALCIAKLLRGQGQLSLYDIQEAALNKSRNLLSTHLTQEEMHTIIFQHCSHDVFLETEADLVIYNLGYLPGGDRSCTTIADITIMSLRNAVFILNPNGHIIVTCYPGHQEGLSELQVVREFVAELDSKKWTVFNYRIVNRNNPPETFIMSRH
ncbi:MAG: class I SAM-dependent methyltransferase [Victivallaceae bacterium]